MGTALLSSSCFKLSPDDAVHVTCPQPPDAMSFECFADARNSSYSCLASPCMAENEGSGNFDTFRECLSGPLIEKSAVTPIRPKKRRTTQAHRNASKVVKGHVGHGEEGHNAAEDLAEFIDVNSTFIDGIVGC